MRGCVVGERDDASAQHKNRAWYSKKNILRDFVVSGGDASIYVDTNEGRDEQHDEATRPGSQDSGYAI